VVRKLVALDERRKSLIAYTARDCHKPIPVDDTYDVTISIDEDVREVQIMVAKIEDISWRRRVLRIFHVERLERWRFHDNFQKLVNALENKSSVVEIVTNRLTHISYIKKSSLGELSARVERTNRRESLHIVV
jgi:hypothetical protein